MKSKTSSKERWWKRSSALFASSSHISLFNAGNAINSSVNIANFSLGKYSQRMIQSLVTHKKVALKVSVALLAEWTRKW